MSDIDSTAATRGTPQSSFSSSYASSEDATSTNDINYQSSGPEERDRMRRRFGISAHHDQYFSIYDRTNSDGATPNILPFLSLPNLSSLHEPNNSSESQTGKFLGHDREFISLLISARGVVPRAMHVLQSHALTPGNRGILDYLPVASPDNSRFIGWREKISTWPSDKLC